MKKMLIGLLATTLITTTIMAKDISSYLYADYKNSDEVKGLLESNGFNVVGEYDAMDNPKYHVIAFTNDTLKTEASKENRGFAGVSKVLVSDKDKKLIFTNPEYFLRAFMQDDYQEQTAKSVSSSLVSAFGKMEFSTDTLEDDDISGFHFMIGQPYYEEMEEIAEGKNLLKNLENNAGKNIVFKLQMKNSTLVGVAMPTKDGESAYIPEIKGEKNAAFLPYMILIEDNKAKIMHAKYYLAIAYPNLSMGEFMSISSTPDAIQDYLTSLFFSKK